MAPAVDLRTYDLIGAIYDAVLEPAGWRPALEAIGAHFGFANATLAIQSIEWGTTQFAIITGVPPRFAQMMTDPSYGSEIVRLWGGRDVLDRLPVEEPLVLSQVTDPATFPDNRYYNDFAVPQGLFDLTALFLTREHRRVGNIALGRHRDAGPITEATLGGLRVLAPHLRRAAIIAGILAETREQNESFGAALEALSSGIVFVDQAGGVLEANPVARRMLDVGDPLRLTLGRLEIPGEAVKGHLEDAINRAAQGDVPLGRRGIAVPGRRTDGGPFLAHVLPLTDRTNRTVLPGRAIAAVFVADAEAGGRDAIDGATLIYALTPAEARVFELVVEGKSSAEIAGLLSIAPSTLKWHTLELYGKTGQHSRADLVQLAGRLKPAG